MCIYSLLQLPMAPVSQDDHLPRLSQSLRDLLGLHRVAALATNNDDGTPSSSMVPFAVDAAAANLVIHVSALSPHTRNLQTSPTVSLLVIQAERPEEPVHALPRVSMDGQAVFPVRDSPAWLQARSAYIARFPEAEPMTYLGDFQFVTVTPASARQIAGFGAARTLDSDAIRLVLQRVK
jgi:putative heme iron utilization protein